MRNYLIRSVLAFAGGYAIGTAACAALTWICVAAALSTFLTFLVWLVGMVMAFILAVRWGQYVDSVVTNQRIDNVFTTIAALFSPRKVDVITDVETKVKRAVNKAATKTAAARSFAAAH